MEEKLAVRLRQGTDAGVRPLVPVEDNRWLVTLVGWRGDHPPPDPEGFLEFAKALPVPDIYDAIVGAALAVYDVVFVTLALWTFEPLMTE